ncbi:adenylyltransferase/cytidyltransferase family protein [Bacteroides fragilis]|uniref:adenylyltransferase/cytidyltransferase family protein n=1 Tax=Bacteroides fragilis TaxID=817 RepID=UPI0022AA2FAC|nr:adenylyltransferase/cytidyltransferase family protein [Bacteroides fragilis]MCZ2614374.1 adenylyltransferase/cytidyltransferase family protein [Bacteroides fragilis]MCZ2625165.1 adenylyltransferase/cytidyltransferase family protein [Bacteroides fragilis]
MLNKGRVYTAGVFDLFHAGHMESIMKILNQFPDQVLIIGVATDKYTKSFKRTPVQTCSERIHTIESIFSTNEKVMVIQDPLETYADNYEKWFYEKFGITDHCQGTDFDENPKVYEYIKSINGFHLMGRSELMSTTELINKLTPSHVIKLDGDTNQNFRLGNIVIKEVIHGDTEFMDDAYTQLLNNELFGVTNYQRFGKLVFLPFIEGNVTPKVSVHDVVSLSEQISKSGLKPKISLLDVFQKYNFVPDGKLYTELLKDVTVVCHGDMAYTNLVKGQTGLIPIDWEFLCYGVKYWDLGCFLASLYIYGHSDCENIYSKIAETKDLKSAMLATLLLCDYWLAWSVSTEYDYFTKELTELREYLFTKYILLNNDESKNDI